jgi:hypothetical protein
MLKIKGLFSLLSCQVLFIVCLVSSNLYAAPSTVSGFTVSQSQITTGTTVNLSWLPTTGASYYNLHAKKPGDTYTRFRANLTSTSTTRKVGKRGTHYIRIQACNSTGCSGYSTLSVTASDVPGIPASLTSNDYSVYVDTTINLLWSGPNNYPDTLRYNLYVKKPSDNSYYRRLSNTSSTSFNRYIGAVGNHIIRVNACNLAGSCSGYRSITVVASPRPPSSPTSLTSVLQQNNRIMLVSWSSVSDATSYQLQDQVNNGSWQALSTSGSSAAFTIADFATHGARRYRVRACSNAGCSPYTYTSQSITTHPEPDEPSGFNAELSDDKKSIKISWELNGDVEHTELEARIDDGAWNLQSVTGVDRTYYVVNFTKHGSRTYRLKACNYEFCTDYISAPNSIETLPLPGVPESFTASKQSVEIGESVLLNWSPAAGDENIIFTLEVKKPWDDVFYTRLSQVQDQEFNRYIGAAGTHVFQVKGCNSLGACGEYASLSIQATSDGQSCNWADTPQARSSSVTVSQPVEFSWNKAKYSQCDMVETLPFSSSTLVSQICAQGEFHRELIRFYSSGVLNTQWQCALRDSAQVETQHAEVEVLALPAPLGLQHLETSN